MSLPQGVTIGPGWSIGAGWSIGGEGSAPPPGTGSITYDQMPGPITVQLQDGSATINDPVGFTINNSSQTGVLASALTNDNITYFNNLGIGIHTATLGAGSTYNSISVNITAIPSDGSFGQVVWFFDPTASYPATFNYPFTFI